MSTLSSAITASASALSAERTRIEAAVSNMANTESTRADAKTALLWLALVTVEQSGAVSVNLRAPIVINPGTMMGQ